MCPIYRAGVAHLACAQKVMIRTKKLIVRVEGEAPRQRAQAPGPTGPPRPAAIHVPPRRRDVGPHDQLTLRRGQGLARAGVRDRLCSWSSRVNLERLSMRSRARRSAGDTQQKSSDRSRLLVLINMAKLVGEETHVS